MSNDEWETLFKSLRVSVAEFNRMIRFVKNQEEGVSAILVYSLDRFSRTGDNAIFISSKLRQQGGQVIKGSMRPSYRRVYL